MKQNSKNFIMNRLTLLTGNHICIVKAQQLANSALKLLGNENDLTNALGLYTLAVEEFGKAILLRNCYTEDETAKKVPQSIFSDHDLKFKKALNNLPDVCKNIMVGIRVVFPSGSNRKIQIGKRGPRVSVAANTSGSFFMKYAANFDVRMNCFYVNWDHAQKRWAFNLQVDKEDLEKALLEFMKHIGNFDIVYEKQKKNS